MRTVLITGTSRRLGRYLTDFYLSKNYSVLSISRSDLVFSGLHTDSHLEHFKIENYDANTAIFLGNQIVEKYPSIDLVIHNASIFKSDEECSENLIDSYTKMIDVHMLFPSMLNKALVPSLKESENSNIIHITDIFAENPSTKFSYYSSTKSGLESLTKSLAKKYAPKIRVNSIQPGPIKFLPQHSYDEKIEVLNETLIKTEGGFKPILDTIEFIFGNTFITGAAIKVDGGRSLNR